MKYVKMIASIWATTLVYLLGGFDISLKCLLGAVALDYITGVSKSYINETLSSYRGLKGIVKKINLFCLVALAVILDNMSGAGGTLRTLIIYYIVSNEGLSIVENLSEMNIIVPDFLKKRLIQVKQNNENEIKKEGE